MATAQNVYDITCFDLMEDGGLQLGLLTQADFVDLLNLVILDFIKQTGLVKQIYTQSVFAGFAQYAVPDTMMMVESAYLSGVLLERATAQELSNVSQDWSSDINLPKAWHEDELPLKTVELTPIPNYNSTYIPGPSEPSPPHSQVGEWSVVISGTTVPASQHRGLTFVGSQKPTLVVALSDPIPLLPDDFALGYLPLGVLARIFAGDSELKDADRAQFCLQQYAEGVMLGKAITEELSIPA